MQGGAATVIGGEDGFYLFSLDIYLVTYLVVSNPVSHASEVKDRVIL